jgi:hypothetical protein
MRCGRRCDACPLFEPLSLQVALQSLVAYSRLPSPKGARNSLEEVPMIPCVMRYPMLLAVQHRTSHREKSVIGGGKLLLHFCPLMSTTLNAAFLASSKMLPALPARNRTRPSSLRSIRCSPP